MLIGVDLEQPPGAVTVRADAVDQGGRTLMGQRTLRVLDAHFPVQRLAVPRPFVDLDAATLERVTEEKVLLDRLWQTVTPDRFWQGRFRVPLDGAGAAFGFGLRRIINGEPRAPHSGADYAAPAGTPVLAAQAGEVALAEDQFFAGRAVVIAHGLGLFTMYFHVQELRVREGDAVRAGQVIGTVGASGRATGAHLHWGARLGGARIDPTALVHLLRTED
jgi:murein DD-endopeptidase MepM/ murein hydrolase activator NlpD